MTATIPATAAAPGPYDVVLEPPAFLQPVGENHVFVAKGVVRPGGKESKSFVLPKVEGMTALLLGDEITWSFRSPRGDTIVPGKTADLAGYDYAAEEDGIAAFTFKDPEPGRWTVAIEAAGTGTTAAYAVDIRADGRAEEVAHLETMLRDSRPNDSFFARPGDPVFVRAYVARRGQPVPGARWDIRALTPRDSAIAIHVFDDGRHADGSMDDGVFVGAIVAEGPDGFYQLRAECQTPAGSQYVVSGTIEVQPKNDLLIADSIDVSPRYPRAGERVILAVTVVNDGTAEFRNVELELWVDMIKMSTQRLDLKPGESRRVATTWVPARALNYVVQLSLNSYDEPYASDLANNTRRAIVSVR
jgi:hypothetical protein